jgi:signal transduction histidine kinase
MKIDLGMLKQNTLKSVNKEDYEILKNQFDELYGLLNNTLKSARQIMSDLRPEVLDLLGFIEAVNQHVKGFGIRNKITSTFINNTKGLELNSQQSVALFRIVQEALNNIAKHARATEVHVILEQQNDKIMLDITDNGVGFDTSDKKKVDSYGLLGMKERVFLLNGNLIINSQIQKGTTIKVFIPNK